MGRRSRGDHGKERTTRRTLNAGMTAVILLLSVTTAVVIDPVAASAHNNVVTGVASCSPVGANHDITWTIANDYNLSETASIVSATGGVGTVSGSPVNIAASPGEPYKTGTMQQVLPGSMTGSTTITVKGVWSDNFSTTDSGTVSFPTACVPPPATVTTAPTKTSIVLGNSDTDGVSVTGVSGVTPTGTVTFYVCGPFSTATACTTAGTNLGAVTVSGSGGTATATSPAYSPTATGTYCFLGVYSGDGNYSGASDGSTTRECFTVTKATPGVTTSPTKSSIVLGNSDTDGVSVTGVSGVTPTGTVTFYVCGPFSTATACTTAGTNLGAVTVSGSGGTATATSPAYSPTATGTYCFLGVYSGDGNYSGASDGSTTRECFTVTMATPGVTTSPTKSSVVLGNSDTDGVTVTGVSGVTPTGTVTFYVCPGNTNPCTSSSTGVVDLGTATLSGSGGTATTTSPAYTPTATGTYCFLGVYSGDGNYQGGSDGSTSSECFTVTPRSAGAEHGADQRHHRVREHRLRRSHRDRGGRDHPHRHGQLLRVRTLHHGHRCARPPAPTWAR